MLLRLLALVENAALTIGCIATFIMGLLVTGSVIGRTFFNTPIPDDLLMIGLLMVCVIILPLSYVERDNGHIAVTLVADRLPMGAQRFLRAMGRIIFAGFLGTMGVVVAQKIPDEFEQRLYYDGQLEIPTWPMKVVFVFGVAVFLLRVAMNLVADIRGDPPAPLKSSSDPEAG